MNKLVTVLVALWLSFCFFSIATFAQNSSDMDPRWSRINIDLSNPGGINTVKWVEPAQVTKYYSFVDGGVVVGPNFRPFPTTNTTQSEMSIDVHPTNENIIFASANATPWPVSAIWGTGVYWSLDGANTWAGADNPTSLFGTTNGGDPESAIGTDGVFYEGYLVGGSYALGMAVSTNSGTSWTTHTVYATGNQDKEHVMVDKEPTSPFFNRVYYPWSNLNVGEISLLYTTDLGTTWSALKDLSSTITPLGSAFGQGPNVQTATNGDVYVCYAVYDANWTDGEDAIGFSKSTDGGATWTALRAYEHVNFGVRGTLASKGGMRVNSFPSMAVDRSGGPNDGNIYICWPQRGFAPAGTDPDIVLIRSTDGGATWSTGVRVNDDPINNGKDQIFPWVTVDQSTGQLMLVFYDSRNVVNSMAEVYMATSYDGGNTFNNFVISDAPFNFGPISGFAGGYGGDYIGIAANNDVAYPYWMSSVTGNSQGWMSKVTFGPPCPIDPASNPNPANNATDVSINLPSISWTNGAGATQIEVWFGQAGSVSMVYSGSPITSWSIPGQLNYNTDYNWQIIGKNDTCNVSSPLWAFTTEANPNIIIDEVYCDDFEAGTGSWTITNDGGTCVWDISTLARPYTMPATATGNVFAADVDLCGSGTSLLSTATLNPTFDLSAYTEMVWFEFDNDWRFLQASDAAHVEVSTDGGTTWTGVWDQVGVDVRNTHEVVDATSLLAGQSNVKVRLRSVQPGWDWWWAVDNFCIYGEYITPVELTSFAANVNEGNVNLNWSTATETNNQGFDVERKTTTGEYQKIGYVAGFGTSTETHSYSFNDDNVTAGSYTYRLKQVDFDGTFEYSNEVNVDVTAPLEFALDQNYPNPFNPSTTIKYSTAQDGLVKLAVYNLLGEEVTTLVNTTQKAGRYEVSFNASNLASGVYVYRLETPNFISAKKLMLMK
jgi:Secretion system C-terminal sorting domain